MQSHITICMTKRSELSDRDGSDADERRLECVKKEKLHRRAKSTISDHQVFHAVCNVVFSWIRGVEIMACINTSR